MTKTHFSPARSISFPCFAWERALRRFASSWARDSVWTQSVRLRFPWKYW